MKVVAALLVTTLAVGGSAFAAERAPEIKPPCTTLAKIKADPALKRAKFTALNVGQLHFMQGFYSAVPPMSAPPPVDNAMLIQLSGKSLIVWMKAECSYGSPFQIPEPLVAVIKSINPAVGEKVDSDDSSEERKL